MLPTWKSASIGQIDTGNTGIQKQSLKKIE